MPLVLCRLLYFQELQGRAKQREQDEAERKRRAQDKFASLLRHLRKLDADTTWDQFLDDYDREPEYRAVSGDRDNVTSWTWCLQRCNWYCAHMSEIVDDVSRGLT